MSVDTLEDIKQRIRTQDNRCTAYPIFYLQIRVVDYGYDLAYTEDSVWIETTGYDNRVVDPDTENAEEVGVKYRWETIMVAFTEQGLLDYMKLDGHNVTRLAHNGEWRIYVESLYRCEEMIRIRNFLSGTTMASQHSAVSGDDIDAGDE